jgi:8-amino-7-oxononanoate synthase
MDLFDKYASISGRHQQVVRAGADPFGVCVEEIHSATEARVNGRDTILVGTNNYLGLTFDQRCIEAAIAAIQCHGTGTTGSRIANGTYGIHRALEVAIARFMGRRSALIFPTGYQANLGVLAGLAGPNDIILMDADSHSSIYDGCHLSGAKVVRFRHNDPEDLDRRLTRLDGQGECKLIVVEGIYSMLGDQAPLTELAAVTREHGAWLLVDEAHSLGVLGQRGCGLAEELGLLDKVDFITGTFSKSVGTVGGFCVSPHAELAWVRNAIRAYIFTASASPANIASSRVALRKLRDEPERRERLWTNARRLYAALDDMGLHLGPQPSPVVAVMLDTRDETLKAWHTLLDHGVYVNLVVPPAANLNLLRCSVSAAHTPEDIDQIIVAYQAVAAQLAKAPDVGAVGQACAPR